MLSLSAVLCQFDEEAESAGRWRPVDVQENEIVSREEWALSESPPTDWEAVRRSGDDIS